LSIHLPIAMSRVVPEQLGPECKDRSVVLSGVKLAPSEFEGEGWAVQMWIPSINLKPGPAIHGEFSSQFLHCADELNEERAKTNFSSEVITRYTVDTYYPTLGLCLKVGNRSDFWVKALTYGASPSFLRSVLPEGRFDSEFAGRLNYDADVMAENLTKRLVDLSGFGLASQGNSELRFNHRKGGFECNPKDKSLSGWSRLISEAKRRV